MGQFYVLNLNIYGIIFNPKAPQFNVDCHHEVGKRIWNQNRNSAFVNKKNMIFLANDITSWRLISVQSYEDWMAKVCTSDSLVILLSLSQVFNLMSPKSIFVWPTYQKLS